MTPPDLGPSGVGCWSGPCRTSHFRPIVLLVATALLAGLPGLSAAQSVVYHLHNEASTTAGLKQLRATGPDVAQAALQTAALQGTAIGEKVVAQFDTPVGVPNTTGKIPSGATLSAVVWLRKTANVATLVPRVKFLLDSSTGTALCTATGTSAVTTTLTAYTISCTTTANVTLTATSRLYVWAGLNMTAGSTTAFKGELGLEGTANGAADSRVDIPTALPAPTITALTPTGGPVGTTVTISGTNFRNQQLSSTVKFFNNRTATATTWSGTSIVVTVPASSTTGAVTVTVAGTASAGVTFTVGPVPTITQLAPTTGMPGTVVTITGTNFGATKGTSTVKFNGLTATTSAWSATSITATVPASAATGPVVVTVGGIASAGVTFTVPTLTSIAVTPGVATLPVGSLQQYRAWGYYSDNVTRDITSSATWASTDGSVATIAVGGLATIIGASGTATISATLGAASGATDVTGAPSRFKPVGSLRYGRHNHTATRLLDGRVLITGGQLASNQVTNTAEIYDPATGRFTVVGTMMQKRHLHVATLLLNGKVLITGGLSYFPDEYHSSAELFDPATGTFSYAGFMSTDRSFHTGTRLADGRVLLDQGFSHYQPGLLPGEIYDPVTELFSVVGSPSVGRTLHTTSLLPAGKTLTAGGYGLVSTELFDPTTGTYAPGPTLAAARSSAAASPLSDGRVLVTGGGDTCPTACSAEVYLPASNTLTPTYPMSVGRAAHTATLLNDGTVLVVGGQANSQDTATAELYDPGTNTFAGAGTMAGTRVGHTATLLQDGNVLLVGGYGPLASNGAELYLTAPIVPLSLRVTPPTARLEVGTSRSFTAVDHLGHPRADVAWSSTNTSVATVNPATGLVTAVASGSATLTATSGSVSGTSQITVAVGPPPQGTPLWTVSSPAGTTSSQLFGTAGGSRGGPALMAVSTTATETEVQALTADGQQQWRTWLPAPVRQAVPNSLGGVVVTMFDGCDGVNPLQLLSIDGPTGIWAWQAVGASTCTPDLPQIAVRQDGVLAVATPGNVAAFPNLMMLSEWGVPLSVPTIPQSTFTNFGGQQVPGYSRVGPTMVDVDGTTHLLYEKRLLAYPPQVVNTGIWLMSVKADQTWTTRQINTTTENTNLFPGRIVPDGNDGLILSWIDNPITLPGQPAQSTIRGARLGSGGTLQFFDFPLLPPLDLPHPQNSPLPNSPELVLGENDQVFASYANQVGTVIVSTAAPWWSYAFTNDVTMLASASDGSLVAKTLAADGTDTILRFQSDGGYATSSLGLANVAHIVGNVWSALDPSGGTSWVEGEEIQRATTGWPAPWPGGFRRARGVYRDLPGWPGHQRAAFDMMDDLRPLATVHEVGAFVCVSGTRYRWSVNYVPSNDQGGVDTFLAQCPMSYSRYASVHLHTPDGETHPSFVGNPNDRLRAMAFPDILFYLSAPRPDRLQGFSFIRYKHSPPTLPVDQNECYWGGDLRGWQKTLGGVVSTCGAP